MTNIRKEGILMAMVVMVVIVTDIRKDMTPMPMYLDNTGMIFRKTAQITGIALTAIGISVFCISYNQGVVNQNIYSTFGCAVDSRPTQCDTSNYHMVISFIAIILSFFTALFGASLVMPSVLAKMIGKVRRVVKEE